MKGLKTDVSLIKHLQVAQCDKQRVLEEKLDIVEKRLDSVERMERSKNIIVRNVKESNSSLLTNIQEIFEQAEINMPDTCIADVFRIGRKFDNKDRPVIVKLIAPCWKKDLLAVSNDITKDKRELNGKLLIARYLLRQKGKESILRNFKLFIDDHCLSMNEISDIIQGKSERLEISTDYRLESGGLESDQNLSSAIQSNATQVANIVKPTNSGKSPLTTEQQNTQIRSSK